MDVPVTRLAWSIAVAILIAMVVGRGAVGLTAVPAFLLVALLAYLVWPTIAARLPTGYSFKVTPGGGVLAVIFGLAFAAIQAVQSGESLTVGSVAWRTVQGTLAVLAVAVVFSVLGATRGLQGWQQES